MLEFDENKDYPQQKPMRQPSGPPKWREGPQIPREILDKINKAKGKEHAQQINDSFSSGHDSPPAHPRCRCVTMIPLKDESA